jgi:hypothetical protein
MMPEKKVSIHAKGVFSAYKYGLYVDGSSLEGIIRAALGDEDIDNRPCDIWINVTLPEQGVDVR